MPLILMVAGIAIVAVHLAFGRDDFGLIERGLAVVPAFPLLWEIHRFTRVRRGSQLPFGIYALLYNYITFSWPALFNTVFKDLSGPVTFSETARIEGTAAVALSSLGIYLGIRLGEVCGTKLQPSLLRVCPPIEVPSSFSKAVGVYACMSMAATELANRRALPGSLSALIALSLSLTFVVGVTLAKPESFRGTWGRYVAWGALGSGIVGGVLSGTLEPLFRLITTVVAARWVYIRRFSVAALVALVAIYAVLQPAKGSFRQQVWAIHGAQETPTYVERASAWTTAIEDLWSSRDAAQTSGDAAVSRFLELDPVLNAFTRIPGYVRPAEGAAWMNIIYSPIPRILWPGKPTTNDLTQSYGVAFNLQSELGARSTAILLSLVVDGYWNFGWLGIVFASVLAGLWVGICQTMYAGEHWALRASGIAQFSQIYIIGSFAILYAGIVQGVVGLIVASWVIHWLSRLLETKRAHGVRAPVPRGAPARRALGR